MYEIIKSEKKPGAGALFGLPFAISLVAVSLFVSNVCFGGNHPVSDAYAEFQNKIERLETNDENEKEIRLLLTERIRNLEGDITAHQEAHNTVKLKPWAITTLACFTMFVVVVFSFGIYMIFWWFGKIFKKQPPKPT